jgi:3-oxoadipate enol-lactonase
VTVELNHQWEGPSDAPVLVFANSLGATTEMWDAQAATLGGRFRLLRVETRGHGGSPAPPGPYSIEGLAQDVLQLLDRNGVARASYCGLSIGGMVGMWLAAHAPDRIDRLALCCTSAHLPPTTMWTERAATVRAEGPGAVADTVVGRWFTEVFREREPGTVTAFRDMIASADPEGYAGCCEAIAAMDLRDDLARITAPTLVVSGAEDPATPPEHQAAIAAAIPGALLQTVPGAHLAPVESPEPVTAALLAHFRA